MKVAHRVADLFEIVQVLKIGSFVFFSAIFASTASAQVTPDGTLGAESSVVTPNVDVNGVNSDRIDGGAIRGANLFHSFQEFNVGEGLGVYFSNPTGIENILTRVTGGNISNILGTLGVLGNADLFLINPNGIFFGPNARLDLGGSFLEVLLMRYRLKMEQCLVQRILGSCSPLLTINVPFGLQLGNGAGEILLFELE